MTDKKRTVRYEHTRPRRESSMSSLKKKYGEDAPGRLSSIGYDLGTKDSWPFGAYVELYIKFFNGRVAKFDVLVFD